MDFQKRLVYSALLAVAILFLSFFSSFIPCKTAPVVPNPQYQWTFCSHNPDISRLGIDKQFYGYTNSLTSSYIITSVGIFLVSMVLLSLISRSSKKGK